MQVVIKFNTDNESFAKDAPAAIVGVLNDLKNKIAQYAGDGVEMKSIKIRDINGNEIGEYKHMISHVRK